MVCCPGTSIGLSPVIVFANARVADRWISLSPILFDNPKDISWLDYGCGIGLLMIYLKELGTDVYGYDNWSQVNKKHAQKFLSKYF